MDLEKWFWKNGFFLNRKEKHHIGLHISRSTAADMASTTEAPTTPTQEQQRLLGAICNTAGNIGLAEMTLKNCTANFPENVSKAEAHLADLNRQKAALITQLHHATGWQY